MHICWSGIHAGFGDAVYYVLVWEQSQDAVLVTEGLPEWRCMQCIREPSSWLLFPSGLFADQSLLLATGHQQHCWPIVSTQSA